MLRVALIAGVKNQQGILILIYCISAFRHIYPDDNEDNSLNVCASKHILDVCADGNATMSMLPAKANLVAPMGLVATTALSNTLGQLLSGPSECSFIDPTWMQSFMQAMYQQAHTSPFVQAFVRADQHTTVPPLLSYAPPAVQVNTLTQARAIIQGF